MDPTWQAGWDTSSTYWLAHQSLWPMDLSETVSESRWSSSQRQTETVCPVQRVQSENRKWTKGFCDVLVDFQTGEIPSTGWIYIHICELKVMAHRHDHLCSA